jgi:hypothetical protein
MDERREDRICRDGSFCITPNAARTDSCHLRWCILLFTLHTGVLHS